ncbi:DUF4132 domain-containing protein [Spirillospora sp. NPDC029432]|uniref:DUF4132 domain-containing protein n=1 Tax=Spirillospora sp. NPDC029432 TaxID=3154599 RepID=UPI003455910F
MSDELPAFLVDPPWEREARERRAAVEAERAREVPLVPGLEPPAARSVEWEPGERKAWLETRRWALSSQKERDLLEKEGWEGILRAYQDGGLSYAPSQAALFANAPEELVRPLLPDWRPAFSTHSAKGLKVFAARFELDALHVVVANARSSAYDAGPALMPFLDAEVARMMADWLVRLKSAQRISRAWFARHGTAAVPFLVPDALGKRRVPSEKATAALSLIAAEHGAESVVEAARPYGEPAAAAVERLLGGTAPEAAAKGPVDKPARPLPTKWLDRAGLPEVRLRDGRPLPPAAVENLIGALTLSPGVRWNGPALIYPGLRDVLDQCDPASLAAFGWAVVEGWLAAGRPKRNRWVGDQLVWLADDEVTLRLGAHVRRRPNDFGNHALGVLGDIGTDTALLQLHRIARRATPGMRRTAEQRLAWAARERGLTADELADRLVPDLGLNGDGTLVLDYGPRRFTVGFDEELKPFVIDEAGKHRKTLPKPGAKDDIELAPASYQRFSDLKKEVRALAGDQIARLERAMVTAREWSADEFRRHFVEHPLVRHIARRLVWATEGLPFRIAEDGTLADLDDGAVTLPEGARAWIAHPMELGHEEFGDLVPAWAEVFADYEIVQPFPQLGRPFQLLTEDERATGRLDRFAGATTSAGALLGLTRRGWERGPAEDGGVQTTMVRRIGKTLHLVIELDPGIAAGAVDLFPEQTLREVRFTEPPRERLSPVAASELLYDLGTLA